jgi:transposase-like protein
LGYNKRKTQGDIDMKDSAEAITMFVGGISVADIAAELDVTEQTVRSWLRDAEVTVVAKAARTQAIIEAYNEGDTVWAICKRFDIAQGTLYNTLHREGVPLRREVAQALGNDSQTVVEMYVRGDTLAAIRRETGRGYNTIYEILDARGIPRRRTRV